MKSRFVLLFVFVLLSVGLITYRYPVKAATTAVVPTGTITPVAQLDATILSGALAVVGDYVYVGIGNGLTILDTSDPATSMPTIGTINTIYPIDQIEIHQTEAYLRLKNGEYRVLDISDPTHMAFYPSVIPMGTKANIFIGDYLYSSYAYHCGVSCDYAGVQITDISDPANPVFLGKYEIPETTAPRLQIQSHYIYAFFSAVTDLQILDITDPTQISLAGTYDGLNGAVVWLSDSQYLTAVRETPDNYPSNMTLMTLSIADPLQPTVVFTHTEYDGNDLGYLMPVNNLLYAELTPNILAFYSYPQLERLTTFYVGSVIMGRYVIDNKLYLATNDYRLYVIDISNGEFNLLSEKIIINYDILNTASNGAYFYAVYPDSVLRLYDTHTPAQTQLMDTQEQPSLASTIYYEYVTSLFRPRATAVHGHYAYILSAPVDIGYKYSSGLDVYDLANPFAPFKTDSRYYLMFPHYDEPNMTRDLAIYRDSLIVVDGVPQQYGDGPALLYSLANPGSPKVVYGGMPSVPIAPSYLEIQGHYAYLGDNRGSLAIVDFSDPLHGVLLGSMFQPELNLVDTAVLGNDFYYVGDGHAIRIDVSNPYTLTVAGYISDTQAVAIESDGTFLHVVTPSGIEVWQPGFIDTPVVVKTYAQPPNGSKLVDLHFVDDFAYVAETAVHTPTLKIYQMGQVDPPALVASYSLPGHYFNHADMIGVTGRSIALSMFESGWVSLNFDGSYWAAGSVFAPNRPATSGSGVTISASPMLSRVTDENGRYTFTNLIPSRTLTPTLEGFSFFPPTQTVPLNAENLHLNFTLVPEPDEIFYNPSQTAALTYTSVDGLVTSLDISAGALSTPINLALTPNLPQGAPNQHMMWASHAFSFGAASATALATSSPALTFAQPVTLTLHYDDRDQRAIANETQLALWEKTGSGWQKVSQTCPTAAPILNTADNELTITLCHSGQYALFGPTYRTYIPVILKHLP